MRIFDEQVLRQLAETFDSADHAASFARTYDKLLDERVERVRAALDSDPGSAIDAVRSLGSASVMVGAVELAELAAAIEEDLKRYDLAKATEHAAGLPWAGEKFHSALSGYLAATA